MLAFWPKGILRGPAKKNYDAALARPTGQIRKNYDAASAGRPRQKKIMTPPRPAGPAKKNYDAAPASRLRQKKTMTPPRPAGRPAGGRRHSFFLGEKL